MKARTRSEVVRLCDLLGNPVRTWIVLELGACPRDTASLVEATGLSRPYFSGLLTELRLGGLVETTPTGHRRVHSLTPTGRMLAEAIAKLSAH